MKLNENQQNNIMKTIVLSILFVFLGVNAFSQKKGKVETVVIQTSAECEQCEERIEDGLNYTKGVKYAELDLTTMKLTVKYRPSQISLEDIKKKISSLGYDADEVKADPKALNELPACCKPGGGASHH